MNRVLLLQSRPEKEASDGEFEAFCRFGELDPAQVIRVQMHEPGLPEINLADYAAVLMGGGPANFSYDDSHKSEAQKLMEPWLFDLFRRIVDDDKPFLGTCLGMGVMSMVLGGEVSQTYSEDVGAVDIELTPEGRQDKLLDGLPATFASFVGHKEGVGVAPPGAVELARSAACCQMLRVGQNVYATQFHPELDIKGIILRIRVYQHHGYFRPEDTEDLIANVSRQPIIWPSKILQNFTKEYIR